MRVKLAVIVAVTLVLVGCSPISSGVIIKRNYSEAYTFYSTYCVAYNSKGICIVWGQRQEYVDESFSFDIQNDKDTGWVTVSETDFHRYEVGDYYGEKR